MACNERGMALVSVILMLALLLVLAQTLCGKLWQSSRQAAAGARRDRLAWAAAAGIELARSRLANEYAASDGWRTLLAGAAANDYPAAPCWSLTLGGATVEIFVRDNRDGDGDPQRDNDTRIFVLARARTAGGAARFIESLCGYRPAPTGVGGRRSGTGGADLQAAPVSSYASNE
jgi:hypothetical protein